TARTLRWAGRAPRTAAAACSCRTPTVPPARPPRVRAPRVRPGAALRGSARWATGSAASPVAPRAAPRPASLPEPEAGLRPDHERAPHEAVPADHHHTHDRNATGEQRKIGVGGGITDQAAEVASHAQYRLGLDVYDYNMTDTTV